MIRALIQWLANLFSPAPDPDPDPEPPPLPGPPTPEPEPHPQPGPGATHWEAMREVNKHRAERGLPPLKESMCLIAEAQGWATEMQRRGRMSHSGFSSRLGACRMQGGECVAWGYSTEKSVVSGWMGSRGHRNILMSRNSHCGIARAGNYWCALVASPVN